MPNDLKTTLSEKFATLPPELKEAMAVVSPAELIYQIGRERAFPIDKIGLLGDIVSEFILGYIGPDEFVNEIGTRLSLNAETAKSVGVEVNRRIFRPIRMGLKASLGLKAEAHQPPPPIPKPVPPPPKVAIAPKAPLPTPPPALAKPTPPPPPQPRAAQPTPAVPPRPQPVPPYVPPPPREAPIIRPLGMMPGEERRERVVVQEVKPSAPARPEPIRVVPPPPLTPPPRPAPPPKPSPVVITKAELEQELERFRQPREALGTRNQALTERVAKPATPPSQQPPAPIKPPQEKLPKPPAPERYTIDPYRESTE